MTNSKAAMFTALMAGTLLAASPALAQTNPNRVTPSRTNPQANQPAQPAQPAQPQFNLSRPERAALNPLLQANSVAADQPQGQQNWAPVQALLPAAIAAARGNDAKYLVAQVQLNVARGTNNVAAQEAALTALLANPSTPPAQQTAFRASQTNLLNARAEAAFAANDFATAERLFQQLVTANPTDTRLQNNLRIVQGRINNGAGALQGLNEQIRTAEAGGGRAPEDVYRRAYDIQSRAGSRPETLASLQRLITAYPTPANWRTGMDFARQSAGNDVQHLVDIYRFAAVANILQANEYVPLASTLAQASFYQEAKSLIDAGIAARAVTATQADVRSLMTTVNGQLAGDRAGLDGEIREARGSGTALQARNVGDALYGYDRFTEAADLYRVAATKGGQDANMLNLRIGAALARAGQRPAAETALRLVTGSRAEVAALWLAWLNRRPG